MDQIEIFRTGRHTAVEGPTLAFGEPELTAMVAAYDPAVHEAPIVVGHPAMDAPAYGWIGGLSVAGDRLQAQPRQVDAAFAELVRAGRYKTVSACFYTPDSPHNPKPGAYYLRHVGFLGAQPPAVKGLKPVSFAEGEEGVVEFAEGYTTGVIARLLRSMREWMIGAQGQEAADKALPSWDIDMLAEQAVADRQRVEPAFSEPNPTKENEVTDAEKAAAEARAAADQAELERLRGQVASFAEQRAAAQKAEDAAFLAKLQAEGRLLPASAPLAAGLLQNLGAGEAVSFAEGRAAETPRDALRALLAAQPVAVMFGEFAPPDPNARVAEGATADDIARASISYQEAMKAKGIFLTNIEAITAVTGGAKA